jgi:hypothetical protein
LMDVQIMLKRAEFAGRIVPMETDVTLKDVEQNQSIVDFAGCTEYVWVPPLLG